MKETNKDKGGRERAKRDLNFFFSSSSQMSFEGFYGFEGVNIGPPPKKRGREEQMEDEDKCDFMCKRYCRFKLPEQPRHIYRDPAQELTDFNRAKSDFTDDPYIPLLNPIRFVGGKPRVVVRRHVSQTHIQDIQVGKLNQVSGRSISQKPGYCVVAEYFAGSERVTHALSASSGFNLPISDLEHVDIPTLVYGNVRCEFCKNNELDLVHPFHGTLSFKLEYTKHKVVAFLFDIARETYVLVVDSGEHTMIIDIAADGGGYTMVAREACPVAAAMRKGCLYLLDWDANVWRFERGEETWQPTYCASIELPGKAKADFTGISFGYGLALIYGPQSGIVAFEVVDQEGSELKYFGFVDEPGIKYMAEFKDEMWFASGDDGCEIWAVNWARRTVLQVP